MTPKTIADLINDPALVDESITFLNALRNLRVVTTTGEIPLQFAPGAGNCQLDLRSLTASGVASTLPINGTNGDVLISTSTGATWYP